MGGRMALSLLTIIPEKIDRMVLIATDGLVFNFWRWLVSETIFANGLIRHAIKNPSWALGLIKRVEKLGLIKKTLSTFLAHQFSDETKRKVLYQQVVSNKKIKPNKRVISQLIKQYSISVRMMYGEDDQIVPAKNAIHFQKKIGKLVKVKRVKWGHSLLNESQVQNIQDLFGD